MTEIDILLRHLSPEEEDILKQKCAKYCINRFGGITYELDYCKGYRIGYHDANNDAFSRYEEVVKWSTALGFRCPDTKVFYDGYNAGYDRAKIKRIQQEHRDILNSIASSASFRYAWCPMPGIKYPPIDWKWEFKPDNTDIAKYYSADCSATASLYDYIRKDMKEMSNTITNIIYNPPATIIFFGDNSKSIVKCRKDEKYDAIKGVAMAIIKHFNKAEFGHHWYDIFKVVDHTTVDGTDIEKDLAAYIVNASLKRKLKLYKKDHSTFKDLNAILKEFPYVPKEEKEEAADILEKKHQDIPSTEVNDATNEDSAIEKVTEIAKAAEKEETLQENDDGANTIDTSKLVNIPVSDKIDYQRIYDLYEAGYTADDISEAMQINVPTVCRSLHMIYPECILGEIRRDENKKTYSTSGYRRKINNKQIKECYEADMTFKEACEYLNLKAVTLGKLEHTIYGKQVFRRE